MSVVDGAWSKVAIGFRNTCGIKDGDLWCWGRNGHGQLGDGTTASTSMASAPVPGLSDVKQLAAGGAHTCARLVDGTVACWGADTSGQLGDGVPLSDYTPALARIACD